MGGWTDVNVAVMKRLATEFETISVFILGLV